MSKVKVYLRELAHARSGDKGSHANIGVIANSPENYSLLEELLTAERVADYFASLRPTQVLRYSLEKIGAFNFVLEGVLQGGGSRSLRTDAQGKALGQALLQMEMRL